MNEPATRPERLRSLDALRGFDMFWILGGNAILVAWADANDWRWLDWAKGQTEHVAWHGFTFWDLIFPLFLFVAGVSLPFSFAARRARGDSDSKLARHTVRRGLALVLLGLIYNGLLKFDFDTPLRERARPHRAGLDVRGADRCVAGLAGERCGSRGSCSATGPHSRGFLYRASARVSSSPARR